MNVVLKVTAAVFILAGLIFGLSQISSLKDQHDDVKYWKSSAEDNYDNQLIEAEYNAKNAAYQSSLSNTLIPSLSGVVSGIFFLALATIVQLLQQLVENTKRKEEVRE